MYHQPIVCRTCLQIARGDFQFYSLDSLDPVSQSVKLKDQLKTCIPEMAIYPNTSICASCCISLRSAYQFRRLCLESESKIQNYICSCRRTSISSADSPEHSYAKTCSACSIIKKEKSYFIDAFQNTYIYDSCVDIVKHSVVTDRNFLFNNDAEIVETVTNIKQEKTDDELLVTNLNSHSLIDEEMCNTSTVTAQVCVLTETERIIKKACIDIPFLRHNRFQPENLQCRVQLEDIGKHIASKETCTNSSNSNLELIQLQSKEVDAKEAIMCNICEKEFKRKHELSFHKRMHMSVTPVKCPKCPRQFKYAANLGKHLKSHKLEEGRKKHNLESVQGKLQHADKIVDQTSNNKNPAKEIHIKEIFTNSSESNSELIQSHPQEVKIKKSIMCNICQRNFKTKFDLKKHKKIHMSVTLLKCAKCQKQFENIQSLKFHQSFHKTKIAEKQYYRSKSAQDELEHADTIVDRTSINKNPEKETHTKSVGNTVVSILTAFRRPNDQLNQLGPMQAQQQTTNTDDSVMSYSTNNKTEIRHRLKSVISGVRRPSEETLNITVPPDIGTTHTENMNAQPTTSCVPIKPTQSITVSADIFEKAVQSLSRALPDIDEHSNDGSTSSLQPPNIFDTDGACNCPQHFYGNDDNYCSTSQESFDINSPPHLEPEVYPIDWQINMNQHRNEVRNFSLSRFNLNMVDANAIKNNVPTVTNDCDNRLDFPCLNELESDYEVVDYNEECPEFNKIVQSVIDFLDEDGNIGSDTYQEGLADNENCTVTSSQPNTKVNVQQRLKKKYNVAAKIQYRKCAICKKLFRTKLQLLQHRKYVHVPRIIHKRLSKHRKSTPTQNTENVGFQVCSVKLNKVVLPTAILNSSNTISTNVRKHICQTWNLIFSNKNLLDQHGYSKHSLKECKYCHNQFDSWMGFTGHICTEFNEHQHNQIGSSEYDISKGTNSVTLKKAVVNINFEHNYTLSYTKHQATTREDWNLTETKLLRSSQDIQYYVAASNTVACNKCKIGFSNRSNLESHRQHVLRTKTCCNCKYTFIRWQSIASHSCDYYKQQVFATKLGLLCRMFTNLCLTENIVDNLPYKCRICGHSIAQLTDYFTHVESHIQFMQYSCKICDKSFKRRKNGIKHVKNVHGLIFSEAKRMLVTLPLQIDLSKYILQEHITNNTSYSRVEKESCVNKTAVDKTTSSKTIKQNSNTSSSKTRISQKSSTMNTKKVSRVSGRDIYCCKICNKPCRRRKNLLAHVLKQHNYSHAEAKIFVSLNKKANIKKQQAKSAPAVTPNEPSFTIVKDNSNGSSNILETELDSTSNKTLKLTLPIEDNTTEVVTGDVNTIPARDTESCKVRIDNTTIFRKQNHFSNEAYICLICGKICKGFYLICDHIYIHFNISMFSCLVCSTHWKLRSELVTHLKSSHNIIVDCANAEFCLTDCLPFDVREFIRKGTVPRNLTPAAISIYRKSLNTINAAPASEDVQISKDHESKNMIRNVAEIGSNCTKKTDTGDVEKVSCNISEPIVTNSSQAFKSIYNACVVLRPEDVVSTYYCENVVKPKKTTTKHVLENIASMSSTVASIHERLTKQDTTTSSERTTISEKEMGFTDSTKDHIMEVLPEENKSKTSTSGVNSAKIQLLPNVRIKLMTEDKLTVPFEKSLTKILKTTQGIPKSEGSRPSSSLQERKLLSDLKVVMTNIASKTNEENAVSRGSVQNTEMKLISVKNLQNTGINSYVYVKPVTSKDKSINKTIVESKRVPKAASASKERFTALQQKRTTKSNSYLSYATNWLYCPKVVLRAEDIIPKKYLQNIPPDNLSKTVLKKKRKEVGSSEKNLVGIKKKKTSIACRFQNIPKSCPKITTKGDRNTKFKSTQISTKHCSLIEDGIVNESKGLKISSTPEVASVMETQDKCNSLLVDDNTNIVPRSTSTDKIDHATQITSEPTCISRKRGASKCSVIKDTVVSETEGELKLQNICTSDDPSLINTSEDKSNCSTLQDTLMGDAKEITEDARKKKNQSEELFKDSTMEYATAIELRTMRTADNKPYKRISENVLIEISDKSNNSGMLDLEDSVTDDSLHNIPSMFSMNESATKLDLFV